MVCFSEAALAEAPSPLPSVVPDGGFIQAQAAMLKYGSEEEIRRAGLFASVNVSGDSIYILNGRTLAPADYLEKALEIRFYVRLCALLAGGGGRGLQ